MVTAGEARRKLIQERDGGKEMKTTLPTEPETLLVFKKKTAYAVLVLCAMTATSLPAQTFTTLFSFNGSDEAYPKAGLVQGTDGNFYGVASDSLQVGTSGAIFKITTAGALTTLYSFSEATGVFPSAGLVEAKGDFYGTTQQGGAAFGGTVFKITSSGILTTLYSFSNGGVDGSYPYAGLTLANGNFYGTTESGGINNGSGGFGTVFKITSAGTLTTLYSFCAQTGCADGANPYAGLVQIAGGNFFGTTASGGAHGQGTVYEITPSGALTTLYSFCAQTGCADGANPYAGLVQATNGMLYGTTQYGGAKNGGTVFEITPGGVLTTLYSFCAQSGCTDGANPYAGLVLASNGDLYGTTQYGGTDGWGTMFRITPSGALKTLYSFCSQSDCADGLFPYAGLLQATNGDFYGTTFGGGAYDLCGYGCGTIFRLSVGLAPFVKTLPTSGKVGADVTILGTELTGATRVSFNGVAATFTVNSTGTAISTTVPAGVTTGTVQVVTPSGTLSSNVPFRVTE
jgi:uncharacterized repeat protein (TIGR03803 family)